LLPLLFCLAALPGCALPGKGQPGPTSLSQRVIPCPCDLDGLAELAESRPSVVVRRDSDLAAQKFHPGAVDVYRVYDPAIDPVAGNQCSYDEFGGLIPDGPAAGTPDLCSPEFSIRAHFFKDVLPFMRLGWHKYHRKGWAPVSQPLHEP
jgi:hypothetical protein